MTIVAGFTFADGLLFCADSLYTGYAHTTHEPKLFRTDCRLGSFVFGFTGAASFARAAILTCQRKLDAAREDADILELLERTTDKEYRRLVLSTPSYANDNNYQYRLLIGVRRRDGAMGMYATEGPALAPCSDYCCLGAGDTVANYIMSFLFSRHMSLDAVVTAATYMMARIKHFVPGCGGTTHLQILSTTGVLTRVRHWDVAKLESLFADFDALVSRILFVVTDCTMADEDFTEHLRRLNQELSFKRASFRDHAFDELVRQLNEEIIRGSGSKQSP